MKKFIALLISASVIAAPIAFAADEPAANQDAAMQQMTDNDQAATAAKPAKKAHRSCHCKNCAHKHRTHSVKKIETETKTTPTAQ